MSRDKPKTGYPEATIIIVNYKVADLLQRTIESLYADPERPDFEIVLIDNSEDEDEAAVLADLAKGRPEIGLTVNSENLGYAKANNQGLKQARGEYIVLLNPDVEVGPGWFSGLRRVLDDNPGIGLVNPLTNRVGHYGALAAVDHGEPEQVMARGADLARDMTGLWIEMRALGFFLVMGRSDVFAKVGMLNEDFEVGGYEDIDYCMRVTRKGYSLALSLGTFVYHHHARSFAQLAFSEREKIAKRNRDRFRSIWGEYRDQLDMEFFFDMAGKAVSLAQKAQGRARDALLVFLRSIIKTGQEHLPAFYFPATEPKAGEQAGIERYLSHIDALESGLNQRNKTIEDREKYIKSLELELKQRRKTIADWEKYIKSLKLELKERRQTMSKWEKYIESLEKAAGKKK